MRERAIQFGTGGALSGILTEPASRGASAGRPVVLMLNAGVLHRVGTCRLHVKVARALAERGFPSLRFDFSGIGDSLPRKDTLPFQKSSVLEVKDAMDHLGAQKGAQSFVLLGLCSGADAAFFTALEEPRAVGIVQIDAFAYRTPRWYVNHYLPRALDVGSWRRALAHPKRTLDLLLRPEAKLQDRAVAENEPDADAPQYVRVFPPRAWTQEGLRKLAARGVRQYYLYTEGMSAHYNYAGQFLEANRGVAFGDTVEVAYWPDCDHLITARPHQKLAVSSITDFVARHFGEKSREEAPLPATAAAG